MGILLALSSLGFAGVNDLVFKQYIHKDGQPLGRFVTGAGLVWTAVFGTAMLVGEGSPVLVHWPISLAAGVMSVLANLLFIGSFRVVPAGTGATIYRLNLVVVAVMGVALLAEAVTVWKIAGIALGAVSIALLRNGPGGDRRPAGRHYGPAMLALAAACVLRATMGIFYKLANTHGIPMFQMLTVSGLCWVVGGLAFSLIRAEPARPGPRTCRFAVLSGLLICGIVYFLLAATRFGEASIIVPITQLSFVLTSVLGVLYHREDFGVRKVAALAAAVSCVVALSMS